MANPDVNQKSEIYETLAAVNTAFAGIVQHLKTLQETGLFTSKASKQLPSFVQELQAECNQEFLETLEAIELEDWSRYGKVRQKWEKYISDRPIFLYRFSAHYQTCKQRAPYMLRHQFS